MDLDAFEEEARRAFEEIPDEYKEGIDGLSVSTRALPHPALPDVYTLGMCLTEPYPSEWVGPDTLRSVVVLYHGSFRRLSEMDPGFDWEEQIWETLTHELRHHLESLAGEDRLEDLDYALDETFKRDEGVEFDPWYYQRGDEVADGVYRVEEDVYLEQVWAPEEFERTERISFLWHGETLSIPRPAELGDVHFVTLEGLYEGPGLVDLVLVRRRRWWEGLSALLAGRRAEVLESTATPRASA